MFDEDSAPKEKTRSRWPWVLALVGISILIIIAAVVVLVFNQANNGLTFLVDFQKATGIDKDSLVIWQGVPIGKVVDVGLAPNSNAVRVKIQIEQKYGAGLHAGSVFTIIPAPTNTGVNKQAVQIETVAPASVSIKQDDVFTGSNDFLEAALRTVQLATPDLADKYLRLGEYRIANTISGNQISRSFTLESGLGIPQQFLMSEIMPSGSGWTKSDDKTERTNIIKILGEFNNAKDAQWNKSTLQVTSEQSLFWTDYTVTEIFNKGQFLTQDSTVDLETIKFFAQVALCLKDPLACSGVLSFCASDFASCTQHLIDFITGGLGDKIKSIPLQSLSVQFTYNVPGTITEANANIPGTTAETIAPIYNGGSAYWSMTGENVNNGITLSVKSRQINLVNILVVVLVIVILAAGVFLLIRRRFSEG